MSYISPITCENTWLSFEDILRLLYKDGYLGTYGDIGGVGSTLLYTDGTEIWRKQMRGGVLYLDHALTPLGFDGAEDIDWENVVSYE
jgi:hypothetical protein